MSRTLMCRWQAAKRALSIRTLLLLLADYVNSWVRTGCPILWQVPSAGPAGGGCYQQVCSHLVFILLDHVTRRCRSATKHISNFMTLQHMEPAKNMSGSRGRAQQNATTGPTSIPSSADNIILRRRIVPLYSAFAWVRKRHAATGRTPSTGRDL